jgi:hypothetical protein
MEDACEARTRKDTPCKRLDIYSNGSRPLHGGMSTGPKTPEGKAKVALNLPRRPAKLMRRKEMLALREVRHVRQASGGQTLDPPVLLGPVSDERVEVAPVGRLLGAQ